MKRRAILVMTHGKFGIEIVKSAEMIMGAQEDVDALALNPGDSIESLKEQAEQIISKNNEKQLETIVLCDLLGGSPSNVGLYLLSKGVNHVLTGLSLPMLIELLQFYKVEENTISLLASVKKTAVEGIHILDLNFIRKK